MLVRRVRRVRRVRTNIIRALFAFFIAHGFLDTPTRTYIACAATYATLVHICAFPFMLIFVLLSMHHFGGDVGTSRWFGAVLFAASTTQWNTWRNTLLWLRVNKPDIFIYCVITVGACGVKQLEIIPLIVALGVGAGGPKYLFIWACCVHAGLSTVHRGSKAVVAIACITLCIFSTFYLPWKHPAVLKISRAHKKKIACTAIGVAVAHMVHTEGYI